MSISIQDLRREVQSNLGRFDGNTIHSLRRALEDYRHALKVVASEGGAEEVAAHRLSLANAALRLQQLTIPTLNEIATEALEIAGSDAIRTACGPTKGHTGREIPSEFRLPEKFAGIVGRVKAALTAK
jgi:hypothetical protein